MSKKLKKNIYKITQNLANLLVSDSSRRYGFIKADNMPSGKYDFADLKKVDEFKVLRTGEFSFMASNHCAAVACGNIVSYFSYTKGLFSELFNKHEIFSAVFNLVGNGPVMKISNKTCRFFQNYGYNLKKKALYRFSDVKRAIDRNQVISFFLVKEIFDWHWVIVIGYREYENGAKYLRILDGWNNSTDTYYKLHYGSLWWSGTAYYLEE